MTLHRSLVVVVAAGMLPFGVAASASPILVTYDMIADLEINGVMHHHAHTVATLKGRTEDLVETPSVAGPAFTLPVGIDVRVEGVDSFFFYTEVVAFAHPEFGYIGLRSSPSNAIAFAFISSDAVGFDLSRDWGPAPLGGGGGTPTTILHVSIGVLAFHAVHSGTLRAEAMPSPGAGALLAGAALAGVCRRRRTAPDGPKNA